VEVPVTALNEEWGDKAAKYSAQIINEFFEYAAKRGKRFILLIHPCKFEVFHDAISKGTGGPRGFNKSILASRIKRALGLPNPGEISLGLIKSIDPQFRVQRLKAYLDPEIPVFDLTPELKRAVLDDPVPIFWMIDEHYTPEGYRVAAEIICRYLSENELKPRGFGAAARCRLAEKIRREAKQLSLR